MVALDATPSPFLGKLSQIPGRTVKNFPDNILRAAPLSHACVFLFLLQLSINTPLQTAIFVSYDLRWFMPMNVI